MAKKTSTRSDNPAPGKAAGILTERSVRAAFGRSASGRDGRLPAIPPAPADAVTWPSGRGDEIATIDTNWPALEAALQRGMRDFGIDVAAIGDDGSRAFLFRDIPGGPVALVDSNEVELPGIAVVADSSADIAGILLEVQRKLGREFPLVPAPYLIRAAE